MGLRISNLSRREADEVSPLIQEHESRDKHLTPVLLQGPEE